MIKEVTYYDIICDRCGKSLTEESETCYPDTGSAEMVAKDSEWEYCYVMRGCIDFQLLKQLTLWKKINGE